MTRYANDWRAAGACISADPDLFFPVTGGTPAAEQEAKALMYCARCTVRQQCLEFAVQTGETHGIWGGTTAAERTRDRRRGKRRRTGRTPAVPAWQEPETRAS